MRLPRVWVRAVFLLSLGLTTFLATPARAGIHDFSAAPPGTERLVEIGPQEWVSVDDHGKVSHAEVPTQPLGVGQKLGAIASVLTTAVLGILAGQNGPYFTREAPVVRRSGP